MPLLFASLLLAADLRLEVVRHSLTGTHCRYRQYVDGLPTDHYETVDCQGGLTMPFAAGVDEGLRSVDGRVARRVIVEEKPLQRYAYDYDVESGALLRRIPLFFHGKPARVFDPNPVAALNDPNLQDRNDAASAVPDAAYQDVELEGLVQSGPLRGPFVALTDRQPPSVAPPDAAGSLLFDRQSDGFEDVNAYFHIDRSQRYLQSLGYVGDRSIAPYAIDVDTHALNGSDNSFFLPSLTQIGRGALSFGEGGTDDAEDADLLLHEYGHALLEWIAPGSFAGSFGSEARAISEGFGDYWAFSAHVATRTNSGRDPFCFADWDARCWEDDPSQQCIYPPGSDCLRRLDSAKTMVDYDSIEESGTEHRNGEIWSSALREIHQNVGKTISDTVLLESIFRIPPRPTFASAARRLIQADEQLYGGSHVSTICAAMIARGILPDCATIPRGELTLHQSQDRGLTIPDGDLDGIESTILITDTRVIEDLFVRVDIDHPLRGDLRIELVAPDGRVILLKETFIEALPDVHTTFGLTSNPVNSLTILRGRSAAGVWRLRVKDLQRRDVGTLLSWGLVLRLAGDAPLQVRPHGERSQFIPVVAHLFGVGATEFASDVRMANVQSVSQTATLVFTRSSDDGRASFGAIDVAMAAGQTVALNDVLASAFLTAGSGTIEVIGDVVVTSRTYAITDRGTVGQQVPVNLDVTSVGSPPLVIAPLSENARVNVGVTETGGAGGLVRVGDHEIAVAPYGHVQFPATLAPLEVSVVSGDARVVAYLSQVSNETGDPMFIPAEALPSAPRTLIAPAISAEGANGTFWRSDLWLASRAPEQALSIDAIAGLTLQNEVTLGAAVTFEDALAQLFQRAVSIAALRMTLPAGAVGGTRIRSDGVSQFVPLLTPNGKEEQHLLFVESGDGFRTNIGIVSDVAAVAEVVVFDAAGTEVMRTLLSTDGGVAQTAVTTRVVNGRGFVRFLTGHGRAYASLVDNGTADATFVVGQ